MRIQNQTHLASAEASTNASTDDTRSIRRPRNEVDCAHVISAEAIRLYAYRKWEIAGKPVEDGISFWLEAEKELTAENETISGRGNSQDADRHTGIRHPHSLKR
jgi:hypothetical protein